MITQWYLTGDCHGDFTRFYKLNQAVPEGEIWGVIILGDAGFNYWLSKSEQKMKKRIGHTYPNLVFYCVRGNHEERPENLPNTTNIYDANIKGVVMVDPTFPYIRYLNDGFVYHINNQKTLILGGAYSVDKHYRLERAAAGCYAGWFPDEQLTEAEMKYIQALRGNEDFDLVLSHTCPFSWMPTDLFLSCVDQSQVDNSMELWMDSFKDTITYNKWCFGHFHGDRWVNDKVRMLFIDIVPLENIMGS